MPTRRDLLLQAAMFSALPGLGFAQTRGQLGLPLEPTPACGPQSYTPAQTPAQTAGPYFTPGSPRRNALREPGMTGMPLRLGGRVLDPACRPLAGVLVDLWQADAEGRYDNDGFRLRGHVVTDAEGRWAFDTVRPGLYPGRTRHLHVKLQPAGGRVLTTQLYFPGEPGNARDGIFDARLLMAVGGNDDEMLARFDFVLAEG